MPTKMLCIFDGLGLVPAGPNNAVSLANMPNFKKVLNTYPWITLHADGESVGQEAGLVGNSEVGHMNLGGLKLVKQLSLQVTESAANGYQNLSDDQLFNPVNLLRHKFAESSKTLHLMGLFSTASVHSDLRHWLGAVEAGLAAGAEKIVLHLISDGRDSDRESLLATWQVFTQKLDERGLKSSKIVLGSLGGRFYAMDRDHNYGRNWLGIRAGLAETLWSPDLEQIQAYFANQRHSEIDTNNVRHQFQTTSLAQAETHLRQTAQASYSQENFDETIPPQSLSSQDLINAEDTVWLINFRTDRMRQTVEALTDLNHLLNWKLTILATNDYGAEREKYLTPNLDNLNWSELEAYYPVFKSKPVQNTLAQRIWEIGKTQLHIAETEKYNHVTFFLNGGQDVSFEGEEHQLIPSNKLKSHAERPEMKTKEVADFIAQNYSRFDYIIANFACPDMVGHTGDVSACVRALEFLDENFAKLLELAEAGGLEILLIADHGNVEVVGEVEQNGAKYVDTAHNSNPVPCIFLSRSFDEPTFYQNLETVQAQYCPTLDTGLVRAEIERRPKNVNLKQNQWLTADQINHPKVPLWYAGAFLLGL